MTAGKVLLGSSHGVAHYRIALPDGRRAFAKEGNDAQGFAAEAAALRWLADAGCVPVPSVINCTATCLVIDWVDESRPSEAAADRFGCDLARLHAAGADRFGAPWAGAIAGLPLPNEAAGGESWAVWYAANRVLPYVRIARDAGTLSAADSGLVEQAAVRAADVGGPPEPPARIHGDCWSGNVLWSGGRCWLIDPAAHGGHRETDLAMLALFGAPFLDTILDAYQEAAAESQNPLASGWQHRVQLHQLHPLLVHVCLFGGSYRDSALAAARAVLRL